jgi:hypothetical protein
MSGFRAADTLVQAVQAAIEAALDEGMPEIAEELTFILHHVCRERCH